METSLTNEQKLKNFHQIKTEHRRIVFVSLHTYLVHTYLVFGGGKGSIIHLLQTNLPKDCHNPVTEVYMMPCHGTFWAWNRLFWFWLLQIFWKWSIFEVGWLLSSEHCQNGIFQDLTISGKLSDLFCDWNSLFQRLKVLWQSVLHLFV